MMTILDPLSAVFYYDVGVVGELCACRSGDERLSVRV